MRPSLSLNMAFNGSFSTVTIDSLGASYFRSERYSVRSEQLDAAGLFKYPTIACLTSAGKISFSKNGCIIFLKFSFHSVPCGLALCLYSFHVCRCANSCTVVTKKAYGFRSKLTEMRCPLPECGGL